MDILKTAGENVMRPRRLLLLLAIVFETSAVLATDLRDVIDNPDKYEGQELNLVGIARVPDYFYLFADLDSAAKTDLSKALLIRMNNSAGRGYRELDRQWVQVTGRMSSAPRREWDSGNGILLERAELLRDRSAPSIADWTVLGVFQNATAEPVAVKLFPRSEPGGALFFLGPQEVDKTIIWEGKAVVSRLEEGDAVPMNKRKIGKQISDYDITFRDLRPGYQFSPEWSDERTLYFRISGNRIEPVPASEAKHWRVPGSEDPK